MKFSSFSNTVRTIFVKFSTVILHPKAFEKRGHSSRNDCLMLLVLLLQWTEQKDYMESVWRCGAFLGHLFVIINLFGQLVPSAFIIARRYVQYNLYILFGIVVLQVISIIIIKDLLLLLIKGSTLIENKTYD